MLSNRRARKFKNGRIASSEHRRHVTADIHRPNDTTTTQHEATCHTGGRSHLSIALLFPVHVYCSIEACDKHGFKSQEGCSFAMYDKMFEFSQQSTGSLSTINDNDDTPRKHLKVTYTAERIDEETENVKKTRATRVDTTSKAFAAMCLNLSAKMIVHHLVENVVNSVVEEKVAKRRLAQKRKMQQKNLDHLLQETKGNVSNGDSNNSKEAQQAQKSSMGNESITQKTKSARRVTDPGPGEMMSQQSLSGTKRGYDFDDHENADDGDALTTATPKKIQRSSSVACPVSSYKDSSDSQQEGADAMLVVAV